MYLLTYMYILLLINHPDNYFILTENHIMQTLWVDLLLEHTEETTKYIPNVSVYLGVYIYIYTQFVTYKFSQRLF